MDHRKTCKHSDIKNFESAVNDWWEKHKPTFPTWQQWQKDKFPESDLFMCARSFMSSKEWKAVSGIDCSIAECSRCINHPMPYRIAAILGIQPIEADNNG